MLKSQRELYEYPKRNSDAVITLEIRGNDLQGLIIDASLALDTLAINGDWKGRAYPCILVDLTGYLRKRQ